MDNSTLIQYSFIICDPTKIWDSGFLIQDLWVGILLTNKTDRFDQLGVAQLSKIFIATALKV